MKVIKKAYSLTKVWGGVFCIVVLSLFTACENFLSGSNLKEHLDKDIAYAKAPSYEIRVECAEGTGTIKSETLLTKKVTDTFVVEFKLSSDYKFDKWQAYTKDDGGNLTLLEDEYISFNSGDDDDNVNVTNGIYKTSATFKKAKQNIVIKPKCIRLPHITSILPSSETEEQYANTQIIITFNMPMKDDITGKINLSYYGQAVEQYFNTPVLSNNNKTLTLRPDANKLSEFIQNLKVPYTDIKVSFQNDIYGIDNNTEIPFDSSDNSFNVRYISEQEHKAPDQISFFVTRKEINLNTVAAYEGPKFYLGSLNLEDNLDPIAGLIQQNRTNDFVYIYGKYVDTGTGVSDVEITEHYLYDEYGSSEDDEKVIAYTKDSENAEFFTDENGITSFCIKYDLYYPDADYTNGAYSISVAVLDAACNYSESVEFYVFNLKTFSEEFDNCKYLTNKVLEPEGKTIEEYREELKNIRISYVTDDVPLPTLLFDYIYIPFSDLKLYCEYKNKTGSLVKEQLSSDEENETWSLNLNVDSVADLKLKLYFYDKEWLIAEQDYAFPPLEGFFITSIDDCTSSSYNHPHDRVYISETPGTSLVNGIRINKEDHLIQEFQEKVQGNIMAYIDSDWYLQPLYSDLFDWHIPFGNYLYGEILDLNAIKEFYESEIPQVEVKEHTIDDSENDEEDIPVIKVTVTLADNTWDNNKYDCIQIDSSIGYMENCYLYKNQYSITLELPQLKEWDVSLYFYGIKNYKKALCTEYVIPKIENAAVIYDRDGPGLYFKHDEYDNFTLKLLDDGSGPKTGTVNIGTESITLNEENEFTYKIPATTIYELSKIRSGLYDFPQRIITVSYTAYDNNDNVSHSTASVDWSTQPKDFALEDFTYNKNSNQLKLYKKGGSSSTYALKNMQLNLYSYNNNSWDDIASNIIVQENKNTEYYYSQYYYYSAYIYNVPSDSFIKIVEYKPDFTYPAPKYLYTGTKNTGKYDYIMANGTSTSSIIVSSDAPVFIHTMITSNSYDECKNWTVYEWEEFRKEAGITVFDMSPVEKTITIPGQTITIPEHTETVEGQEITIPEQTVTTEAQTVTVTENQQPKVYNIPVASIEASQCYRVIVHFADGHTEMSPVFQK